MTQALRFLLRRRVAAERRCASTASALAARAARAEEEAALARHDPAGSAPRPASRVAGRLRAEGAAVAGWWQARQAASEAAEAWARAHRRLLAAELLAARQRLHTRRVEARRQDQREEELACQRWLADPGRTRPACS